MSASVVFLQHQTVETMVVRGQAFEVWLRVPGQNVFIPKPAGFSGTGFLIYDGDDRASANTHGHQFLVTAKHVALGFTMTEQDLLIGQPDCGRSAIAQLKKLAGTNVWLHHEKADV
jgi:hypothetical protein